METDTHSNSTASQADDGRRPLPSPLTRGRLDVWLRRGEQLGRAALWIAATAAAGHKRAANWRRQVASNGPNHPPPAPG